MTTHPYRGGKVSDDDLMFRPATELAAMVRSGEISARELVQTSLDRIEGLNPKLNAFVEIDGERALAAADAVGPGDPRPFAGVPIAIKSYLSYGGTRTEELRRRIVGSMAGRVLQMASGR
jgi:Asp-tRNA(Asn)/Glu-tRNA(Gln) amidotransferase A subunit family amidase